MSDDETVTLTVHAAEKRDAGRGVARLPEPARRRLGVLSGDTVVIEGDRATVAKVWPTSPGAAEHEVHIDADTRRNAGVNIGDEVAVRQQSVREATAVTVRPPTQLVRADRSVLRRVIARYLEDRPITANESFRVEELNVDPFRIRSTDPDGPVRVTDETRIDLEIPEALDEEGADTDREGAHVARTTYEDIGGLDEELELVREMIELPLNEPEVFQHYGIEPPRGVLLHGPPGTGKTLIARAVANEVDAEFITVDGPEVMSKYKGESEERLRELFERASEEAPAIVFFDEIDSLASTRSEDADVENRLVGQLLSLMDGLESRGDVIVIGATNRVDSIDPALRRGGRFDREIEIGVPDEHGRREILEVHTRAMPLAEDVSVSKIASRTHGFVGADLDQLTTEAAMVALRRHREETGDEFDPDRADVTKADFDDALAAVEPSAMREFVAEAPEASFADVGGLDEAKETLTEAVEWPLTYTELFEQTATDPPSGVLLYGPPGTGKTLLARALAGETDVNFVSVEGPELLDRYVGESERAVRKVFERARQSAPSILFFDEIDAISGSRGDGSHEVTERVVSQLLTELDGLADNPNLMVLAATNRREDIDPALLRPGRIDTHVEVPHPDEVGRREILGVHGRGKPLGDDVDLDELAAELEGYTGADLAAVVRQAAMAAIREFAAEHGPEEANERADEVRVTAEHVERALDDVEPSIG